MHRHAVVGMFVLSAIIGVSAQTGSTSGSIAPSSDPLAISLAQKSLVALTGGTAISDVTLNVNVIAIAGSDNESGTGTLRAAGAGGSRIDLNLNGGTRSEIRTNTNGSPSGAWQSNGAMPTSFSQANCWTDAAWFFPALSSIGQVGSTNVVIKYIGTEQHGGVNTQHVQIYQTAWGISAIQRLSTMDLYLDPVSYLPLALVFQMHPDFDAGTNIPAEVRFANYQSVNGLQVPFHIQKMLSGGVVLDLTVTSVAFNTGLSSSTFFLQ